ncbi:alpha-hydroxy-acid oxidizing protein [Treponema zioleckii]|uniref:alpha-hydroxy-acid oxidizing protein n=1 Tax=Treponema zioleckii TaxID=331680 RepID=UPI00168B1EB8|nr:alpha-hydroxy-acid oxidizing protein [Treponema zioleckii]
MTYEEVLQKSKEFIGAKCKSCTVCNGLACKNMIPGPGSKGSGTVANRNFEAWQKIFVNMDTIYGHGEIDTSLNLFGHVFKLPVFAGPVGSVNFHYGDKYDDTVYNDILVHACAENGIAAFTGDGVNIKVMEAAGKIIKDVGGIGVPTVKPWNFETIVQKMNLVKDAHPFAMAMDIDGAGLPFLKNMQPPAGSKSVEELREIIKYAETPFIVKGIMTVRGAKKAVEAGASAIVVSNHGGRVLDGCPATATVLPEIADAVGDKVKIIVDGGIRTGVDVFKALALGADAVIIARPFVNMVYGAEAEGVKIFIDKLQSELSDAMAMTGAKCLKEITRDMVRFNV